MEITYEHLKELYEKSSDKTLFESAYLEATNLLKQGIPFVVQWPKRLPCKVIRTEVNQ